MSRKEGRRWIFETGLILNFLSCLNVGLGFATPYWIISWPRVYSPFRRMGLWEACFSGLVLPADTSQKAYHGCWWILAPEYYKIRGWIMPPWFIFVQVAVTVCFVMELVLMILGFLTWLKVQERANRSMTDEAGLQDRSQPICFIQTITTLTIISSILKTVAILVFGIMFKLDRLWLPFPYLNYPSFSYGLFILSTFFSIFAGICHFVHTVIVRNLVRAPPMKTNISMPYLSVKPEGEKVPIDQVEPNATGSTANISKAGMVNII